jgi:hypothetical protein
MSLCDTIGGRHGLTRSTGRRAATIPIWRAPGDLVRGRPGTSPYRGVSARLHGLRGIGRMPTGARPTEWSGRFRKDSLTIIEPKRVATRAGLLIVRGGSKWIRTLGPPSKGFMQTIAADREHRGSRASGKWGICRYGTVPSTILSGSRAFAMPRARIRVVK